MIIYTYQKSKKKKPNAKQRELQNSWQDLLNKYKPMGKLKSVSKTVSLEKPPAIRQTPKYQSLNGGVDTAPATKKEKPIYTGTEMLGIGTLHKSNAVPIFNSEEARDQASMRR